MSEKVKRALELNNMGFNCSQSVVGVFCEKYCVDEQTAMKLSCGFGGGFRCGEVCGAVSGAVMVIGLKYGQYLLDDIDARKKCSEVTLNFMEEYKKRNNSYLCREILEYDLSNKEQTDKFADKKKAICTNAIELAVKILEEIGV